MLLQDFFTIARPQRVYKKFFLPKNLVHCSYYLKSDNIIGQRKTTNTEKQVIHD